VGPQMLKKHLHKPGTLPISALIMLISLVFTIIFDIPVARQVIGFIFVTIIPGFAIVRLMKLEVGKIEMMLFSVGISLAFWMISTFFMNLILPYLGFVAPLSLDPILVLAVGIVVILVISEWRSSLNLDLPDGYLRLALYGALLAIPVILTLTGVYLVRTPPHNHNLILLIMLVAISVLVVLTLLAKRIFRYEVYPFLLLVIATCLMMHISLFSSYLQGGDIFGEYSVFRITALSGHWDLTLVSRLSAMLSITTLPTTYYNVLNLEPVWIFKIVYPLIFALVPLGLYQLYKSKMSIEVSFLAAFLFISNLTFFTEIAQLARQMIGELFYVLLFLTLFTKSLKGSERWVLFFVFGVGLVVSHYAMTLIFLAFLVVTWLIGVVRKSYSKTTLSLVILLGILTFAWYIYTSQGSTFNDLLGTVNYVRASFTSDFFEPASRSGQVLQAVGVAGIGTSWHIVGRYLYYIIEGLIITGFIISLLRERFSFFDDDRNVLIFLSLSLLAACIILPNFSTTFNASRFFQVALFFLAPLCILGGLGIMQFLSRRKIKPKILVSFLAVFLLVPFFLFQTGFVYEVTHEESYSLPLSSYRFDPLFMLNFGVITEAEFSSGTWLSKYADLSGTVYADVYSATIFISTNVQIPSSVFLDTSIPNGSYVYLREYNVADEIVFSSYGQSVVLNLTQMTPSLSDINLIYSSGSCEIYRNP
jgi:uncharacterized membrane protein